MNNTIRSGSMIKKNSLPDKYPTHLHEPEFWECLGRTVATFGFLEEILAKAIFAFTATTSYNELEIEKAFNEWLPKLERSLSDQLGNLIDTYGKSVRDNPDAIKTNLDELLNDLREASKIRNVICHGSWRNPDSNNATIPFFVNRQLEIFDTHVDKKFLNQVRVHTTELICCIIDSVTYIGWKFPGSNGPGKVI